MFTCPYFLLNLRIRSKYSLVCCLGRVSGWIKWIRLQGFDLCHTEQCSEGSEALLEKINFYSHGGFKQGRCKKHKEGVQWRGTPPPAVVGKKMMCCFDLFFTLCGAGEGFLPPSAKFQNYIKFFRTSFLSKMATIDHAFSLVDREQFD